MAHLYFPRHLLPAFFILCIMLSPVVSRRVQQEKLHANHTRLMMSSRSAGTWHPYSTHGKTVAHTPSFSEEHGGYSGRQSVLIAGIECHGGYCDNKRLVTVAKGSSRPVLDTRHWTSWFSEEGNNQRNCPGWAPVVNEIQCSGSHCDNMRLQCGRLGGALRARNDYKWSGEFSEEQGQRMCPDSYYVAGLRCGGSFCDNINLLCVKIETYIPPPPRNLGNEALAFRPIYYYDGGASPYCYPDVAKKSNDNTCRTSYLADTPIYWEHRSCQPYDVFMYWTWYGDQKGCINGLDKGHGNDWERISVFVQAGMVQKVMYHQHTGHYTRRRGKFDRTGERPHVYIGKVSHGSYHAGCDGQCSFHELVTGGCLGKVGYCQGGCGYWDDFRNPGSVLSVYSLHEMRPGQKVDGIERPNVDVCKLSSCKGASTRILEESGCWQNEQ